MSGSNNFVDLGTKRLGKSRLSELINFCNLCFVVGDTFAPFSEHVFETKQVVALVNSLKKNSGTVASIIAHASLIQSALGQRAMDTCSASNSDGISCQQVVEKSFNSWSGLLLMMFTTLLVIAAGFAFYKWRNRGWQQRLDGDSEVNETSESHAARVARYNDCSLSEASDPDLWMQTRHFQGDPLAHDERDGPGNLTGFEDRSVNHEVALLMVRQKFFNE